MHNLLHCRKGDHNLWLIICTPLSSMPLLEIENSGRDAGSNFKFGSSELEMIYLKSPHSGRTHILILFRMHLQVISQNRENNSRQLVWNFIWSCNSTKNLLSASKSASIS